MLRLAMLLQTLAMDARRTVVARSAVRPRQDLGLSHFWLSSTSHVILFVTTRCMRPSDCNRAMNTPSWLCELEDFSTVCLRIRNTVAELGQYSTVLYP